MSDTATKVRKTVTTKDDVVKAWLRFVAALRTIGHPAAGSVDLIAPITGGYRVTGHSDPNLPTAFASKEDAANMLNTWADIVAVVCASILAASPSTAEDERHATEEAIEAALAAGEAVTVAAAAEPATPKPRKRSK